MAGATRYPESKGVMIDRHKQVYAIGGAREVESKIPGGRGLGPFAGRSPRRVKQIDGWLYVAGGFSQSVQTRWP